MAQDLGLEGVRVWPSQNCSWVQCADREGQRELLAMDGESFRGISLRVQLLELKMSPEEIMQFVEEKLQVEEEVRQLTISFPSTPRGRSSSFGGRGIPQKFGNQSRRNSWEKKGFPGQVRAVSSNEAPALVRPSSPMSSEEEEPHQKANKGPRNSRAPSKGKSPRTSSSKSKGKESSPPRLIVPPPRTPSPPRAPETRPPTPTGRSQGWYPPCPHCWKVKGWCVTSHPEHVCYHNPANKFGGKGGQRQSQPTTVHSGGKGAYGRDQSPTSQMGKGKGKGKGKGQ